ncbi:hemerythrin domain-containing protein [Methanomassiliicoccus luminyensis]|uniref:hemerythrin domain-containing protein n=1 Tax=Methanomassiliicoccus luminyensis TaxID=1080712 RepID=UPI000379D083|nr:hemerythrin domain-containing protein [Methanomassiliicoccus luminyensis]
MNLEERIVAEHNEYRKMLEKLTQTGIEDADLRMEVYADLSMRVEAHERAEAQTLHAAIMKEEDVRIREIAMESLEQERIIRLLLVELRKIGVDDELWMPKLRVLKSIIENHFMVEEGLVIPAAKDLLDKQTMDRLSDEYEGRVKEGLMKMSSGPSII